MKIYTVDFLPKTHAPVQLEAGARLSEQLSVANSPLLFGCRTGICGTCLIEVIAERNGELPAPAEDEKELLEIIAPDNPRARLACQLVVCADMTVRKSGVTRKSGV